MTRKLLQYPTITKITLFTYHTGTLAIFTRKTIVYSIYGGTMFGLSLEVPQGFPLKSRNQKARCVCILTV